MKKILATVLFTLATLAWASAQQPGSMPPQQGSGAATSPGSQAPGATQSQPATPGNQAINAPVTEGCLGGSNPNYTITDKAGTTYKLNIPPNANTSVLAQHVGESVQVAGNVNGAGKAGNSSIDVQGIGRGSGNCPGSPSTGAQPPPKQ
jgi:hypothetical protein